MSGRRILRALGALTSAGVLVVTVSAGSLTMAANHLASNVTKIDISDQVGDRPVDYGDLSEGPVTFLFMGSDARTGSGNSGYGSFDGARSDTTMLAHIYPDRRSALVVSIPRDTVVTLPACKDASGQTVPAAHGRFNLAFDRGGPGCTVKTVERLSGVTVDHFVVLDFNGFKKTIDALGGVEVCLTRPLVDAQSKVDLPAGRTRVTGEEALGFVRVRHNIGDGSDISRIGRQQLFLSSLIQEVSDSGLLTDPKRLWRVLRESSKSVATDPALADLKAALALGRTLRGLRPDDITFTTLPWRPSGDGATVEVNQSAAQPIWDAIANETPWPPPPTPGADGRPLTTTPDQVAVNIHNATGRPGQATAAQQRLSAQRFRIGVVDSAATPKKATTIRYAPAQLDQARTLQAALPGARLKEVSSGSTRIDLSLGRDYSGVTTLVVKSTTSGSTKAGATTAGQDFCTG